MSSPIRQRGFFRPDFPFSPAGGRVFYGWVVVVVGTLGIIASIPGQTMGISVFTDYLIANLGLSRVQISLAYFIGTGLSGFLLPRAGAHFDKHGARIMGVLATVGTGLVLFYLSQSDRIARFLASPVPAEHAWMVAFAVICVGFFMVRFAGQGVLTMTMRSMMAKWFNYHRGKIMAIAGIFISMAFSLAPPSFNFLIGQLGWRGAWIFLGCVLVFGMGLVAWLFARDNPEESGLEMDAGARPPEGKKVNEDLVIHHEFTKAEAVRTYSFWAFNLSLAWYSMFNTAYTFHVVAVGEEFGMGAERIVALFVPIAVISVVTNISFSWLSDRARMKYLLLGVSLAELCFCLSLLAMPSLAGVVGLVMSSGIAGGGFVAITNLVWPRFFGRKHLGAISGVMMAWMVIASGVGPLLFALSKDFTGGFSLAYFACAFVPAFIAAGALRAENPQRRMKPAA